MKSQVLANFPYIWITVVGFVLFLVVYMGVVFFALNKKNKKLFEECSNIPLEDEKLKINISEAIYE